MVSLPAFLAIFREFCTPSQLLDLLIARFNVPPPKNKSPENLKTYSETLQSPVGLRVLNILKSWIDKHYYDFEDESIKTKLLEFINTVLARNAILANWASVLKATIAKKEVALISHPFCLHSLLFSSLLFSLFVVLSLSFEENRQSTSLINNQNQKLVV
jgi:son of sevenless-like protein